MLRPHRRCRISRHGMPLLMLLLSVATGCKQSNSPPQSQAQDAAAQSQQLKVVATFLPMYWFTKAVAGDLAKVEVLIPPGTGTRNLLKFVMPYI